MDGISIVKWSYTSQEWRLFQKWKAAKRSYVLQVVSFFRNTLFGKNAHVHITNDHVWINNSAKSFQNGTCCLRDIRVREEGKINVLEINYNKGSKACAIIVPVPKGKLREAIEVQQYFRIGNASV